MLERESSKRKRGESSPCSTIRQTQRASKRCEPCATRRTKCDGKVPCAECTTRGKAHMCRRELVIVKGRVVGGESALAGSELEGFTKEDLWSQIQSLKAEIQSLRGDNAEGSAATLALVVPASLLRTVPPELPSEEIQASNTTTMSSMHNGFVGTDATSAPLPRPDASTHDMWDWDEEGVGPSLAYPQGLLIPPMQLSQHLAEYAFDGIIFLIGAIPTSFKHEIESVRQRDFPSDTVPLQDLIEARPCWSALYLALLSVALVYVRPEQAALWGVPTEHKLGLARLWFRASLSSMMKGAACLARPSLRRLQTFCVMTLLFQPFDCMVLHDVWLGSMVQAAHTLALHRLRDRPHDRTESAEIGRRIWSILLSREVHYSGEEYCPSVSRHEPSPFSTFLNIDEPEQAETMPELSLTEVTRMSFLIAASRVTAFTRDLKYLPLDTHYSDILALDNKLRTLFDDMPWLHRDADLSSRPAWVASARHVIALKVSQRRLYLHRRYFALTASHETYAPSRKYSLEAALELFEERGRFDQTFDDRLETINGILPAAIVLLLDAIYPLPNQQTTYEAVLQRCEQIQNLLLPIRSTSYAASSRTMSKTLSVVDNFLRDTMQAAQVVQLAQVQSVTAQPEPIQAVDFDFNAALDEFSFETLLDGFEKDWTTEYREEPVSMG